MKGKAFILILIAIIYGVTATLSLYLKIDFLLFFLATPWNVIVAIMSGLLMHESFNSDCWLLAGSVLNLIIFLWAALFKPMLNKAGEIPD
jgi:hypothetical protein